MSTIYYDIECDFTQIPNHIILNPKVSGTAKAIYFYIVMRLRQNAKWEFYDFDIMEHLKEGRDSFRNAKKELLEYGYLVKVKQNIGNDGKYKGCDYAIKKEPITENPTSAKPKTDEPTSGNPYTNNKKQSNNINKKQSNQDKGTASGFSETENPTVKDSLTVQKPKKEIQITKKEDIESFVRNFKATEFEVDGVVNRQSIFTEGEIVLIVEYFLRRKEKHKSKASCSHQAIKAILNQILEIKGTHSLEVVFEQRDGCYVNCGTAGDPTKPWIKLEPQYFEKLIKKPTFNNQNGKPKPDYFAIDKKYAGTKDDDFFDGYINGKE